ncbi:hypothetical protein Y1Q_0014545 [Alligator mississippiensis]|uniref:Uncharacterized protein n=1 Tax=Alligator mississippiensis TaxID=8496 RepID=A0A151PD16_ALLMI|nr:hypothetical protein Y1Q_0014545 [Alligator mississippiensis]
MLRQKRNPLRLCAYGPSEHHAAAEEQLILKHAKADNAAAATELGTQGMKQKRKEGRHEHRRAQCPSDRR